MKILFFIIISFNILLAELVKSIDGNIVSDTVSHLQWQNNETESQHTTKNWEDGIAHCETLDLSFNTDWRLPNIRELKSIVQRSLIAPAMDTTNFSYVETDIAYWSSSTYYATSGADKYTYAWSVNFGGGISSTDLKTRTRNVRCVRDSE